MESTDEKYTEKALYDKFQVIFNFILTPADNTDDRIKIASKAAVVFESTPISVLCRNLIKLHRETNSVPSYEHLLAESQIKMSLSGLDYQPNIADASDALEKAEEIYRGILLQNNLLGLYSGFSSMDKSTVEGKLGKLYSDYTRGSLLQDSEIDLVQLYDERKKIPGGLRAFVPQIDEALEGFEFGTLCVIGGFAGSFKTTYSLNLAYRNAISLGYNVVFVTFEVPKEVIWMWLLSRHSLDPKFIGKGHPATRTDVQKARLGEDQEKFLKEQVIPDIRNCPSYGNITVLDQSDFPAYTPEAIKERIRLADPDTDAVFIDYAQLFKFFYIPGVPSGNEKIDFFARSFSEMAKDFFGKKICVFLMSQINRKSYERALENGGAYTSFCFSESNELERSSYYAITLFASEDMTEVNEVQVQIVKHRGGSTIMEPFLVFVDPKFLVVGERESYSGQTPDIDTLGVDDIMNIDLDGAL